MVSHPRQNEVAEGSSSVRDPCDSSSLGVQISSSSASPSSCCGSGSGGPWWGGRQRDGRKALRSPSAPSYAPQGGPKNKKRIKREVDVELAKELNEMTMAERERLYEDIHGVCTPIEKETPEMITKLINEMNAVLDDESSTLGQIPVQQRRIYQKALFLYPKLKQDINFKLLFLRGAEYNPKEAAKRLINHYIHKRQLFCARGNAGSSSTTYDDGKLVKKITLDDLTEEELELFKQGVFTQIPTLVDQAGRPVIYCNPANLDSMTISVESCIRCHWYLLMHVYSESEDAQLKGIVSLVQKTTPAVPQSPEIQAQQERITHEHSMRMGQLFKDALPGRMTGFHVFYDTPKLEYWVLNWLPNLPGNAARLHFRGHFGSAVEIEYSLLAYGVRLGGLLQQIHRGDKSAFEEYLIRRKQIDDAYNTQKLDEANETGFVLYPNSMDTIIGRGRPFREFIGNQEWNIIVDKHALTYQAVHTKPEKSAIAKQVLADYKASSKTRFLLELSCTDKGEPEDCWKILDLDKPDAKDKASVALQNRVKVLSKQARKN